MRSDLELHELPVSRWTQAEGLAHLTETFGRALASHPDLMEPDAIRCEGTDAATRKAIMRRALGQTFAQRHPNPFGKPADASPSGER